MLGQYAQWHKQKQNKYTKTNQKQTKITTYNSTVQQKYKLYS